MKITIEFDNWAELESFRNNAAQPQSAEVVPEEKTPTLATTAAEINSKANAFLEAQEQLSKLAEEAESEASGPVEPAENVKEEVPFEEEKADEPEEPAKVYELVDVQKAVRALMKSKGKDAAKAVLEKFGAKGASSVKIEDYPAIVPMLEEALNA